MITHSHLKKFSKLELERRQQTVKISVNMDTLVTAENVANKLVDVPTLVYLKQTSILHCYSIVVVKVTFALSSSKNIFIMV